MLSLLYQNLQLYKHFSWYNWFDKQFMLLPTLLLPPPFMNLFACHVRRPEFKTTLQHKRALRLSQMPMKALPDVELLSKMLENIKPEQFKRFGKKPQNIHQNAFFCQKENNFMETYRFCKNKWEGEQRRERERHTCIYVSM